MNDQAPLWRPSPADIDSSAMMAFARQAETIAGRDLGDYDALQCLVGGGSRGASGRWCGTSAAVVGERGETHAGRWRPMPGARFSPMPG